MKAQLTVSVVKVNPDPALTQTYFGGGGADGKGGGSEELHWGGGGWAEISSNGLDGN